MGEIDRQRQWNRITALCSPCRHNPTLFKVRTEAVAMLCIVRRFWYSDVCVSDFPYKQPWEDTHEWNLCASCSQQAISGSEA